MKHLTINLPDCQILSITRAEAEELGIPEAVIAAAEADAAAADQPPADPLDQLLTSLSTAKSLADVNAAAKAALAARKPA